MGCRGFHRQIPADAAASQLCITSGSTLPLLPGDGTQPPPEPTVKFKQYRRSLAEAEVATPPNQVDRQFPDDLPEAFSARALRQLPNLCLEAGDCLRRNETPRLSSAREAEAQELTNARFSNRALCFVDLEPEAPF